VNATGIGFPKPVFYLDLYDPNGIWKNGTSYAYSNSLKFTADSTGNWLIRVHIYDDTHGFYNLYVSVYYPSGGGGVAQSSMSGTDLIMLARACLTFIIQTELTSSQTTR
jgi:hypothetical protein